MGGLEVGLQSPAGLWNTRYQVPPTFFVNIHESLGINYQYKYPNGPCISGQSRTTGGVKERDVSTSLVGDGMTSPPIPWHACTQVWYRCVFFPVIICSEHSHHCTAVRKHMYVCLEI